LTGLVVAVVAWPPCLTAAFLVPAGPWAVVVVLALQAYLLLAF
jgi:hypothetical protein